MTVPMAAAARRLLMASAVVLNVGAVPAQTPQTTRPRHVWDWSADGALEYGREYIGTLPLTNRCKAPISVATVSRVPELSTEGNITVPAGKTIDARFRLKTPERPGAPPRGGSNQRHDACLLLRGIVELTYIGKSSPDDTCPSVTSAIDVIAHVHWTSVLPAAAETKDGANECAVWWRTGQRPSNDPSLDERCTDVIRELASAYREHVLNAVTRLNPKAWTWLPSPTQINKMSVAQLLEMNRRAADQVGVSRAPR